MGWNHEEQIRDQAMACRAQLRITPSNKILSYVRLKYIGPKQFIYIFWFMSSLGVCGPWTELYKDQKITNGLSLKVLIIVNPFQRGKKVEKGLSFFLLYWAKLLVTSYLRSSVSKAKTGKIPLALVLLGNFYVSHFFNCSLVKKWFETKSSS